MCINIFLDECKYHNKSKNELINARILKMQYNLKPPILNVKNKHLKKVSIFFKLIFHLGL